LFTHGLPNRLTAVADALQGTVIFIYFHLAEKEAKAVHAIEWFRPNMLVCSAIRKIHMIVSKLVA
jgi:hypothetical protein